MSARRKRLFDFQKERIEHLAVDAAHRRSEEPFVILVLDLTDSFAKQIAAAKSSPAQVDSQIALSNSKGVDPCVLLDTTYHDAGVFFERTSSWPTIRDIVNPKGTFAVAIVGDAGVSFCTHTIPE
jgi:hypothetical protein